MEEAIVEFVAEAREGIEAVDAKLVAFEQNPGDPALLGDIFRLIHSIKGTSGFLGLARLQAVAHAAENVLGAFRDGELAVEPQAVGAVLEAVDVVRDIVEALAGAGAEPPGDDAALIARLDRVFAGTPAEAAVDASRGLLARLGGEATLDCACEMALPVLLADPVQAAALAGQGLDHLQGRLCRALTEAARQDRPADLPAAVPELTEAGRERLAAGLSEALAELDAEPSAVAALLPPLPPKAPAEPAARPAEPAAAQTIRVGIDALETLMTTVSELVLIRNQLIQALRDQPDSPFAAPLHRLNQVTSELQEGVMTTRMQPISGAWAKLPRLVRDLAADLGKRIDLTLTGQDTELDRQVMELIKDPLTHMIRNACDHGLEGPDERVAVGKPATGRISLSARHEGGAILIEMADDGRGLDTQRIKAKAVSNGLIPAAQAATMDDAEARQLIFAPGFSTAETVTTVSGRGVGMDVVRTNIEQIGGAIDLASTPGRGTRFTIRIPLTLSIVSALIVECAGERFALPQSGIVELVSLHSRDGARRIETLNGAPVMRLRDSLLPLVSLSEALRLDGADEVRDACVVVARVGGFQFGVRVDRVFDTEEIVVKPVASLLRSLRVYSGATILGDGAVVMILDFKGLALEAGAGALLNRSEEAVVDAPPVAEATEPLLVFRAADGALKAAPLARVSRIEELAPAQVETVDGRTVSQYRGRLMPVLDAAGEPVRMTGDRRLPLLVFARDELRLGLLVQEIVDIVEAPVRSDLPAATPGMVGSVILDGQAAGLIDTDFYWRRVTGEPEPDEAPAGLASGSGRLLVLDDSPFTQLMVRPLLMRAGYAVHVAASPEAALALHAQGRDFDLILADTSARGDQARRTARALLQADRWRETPLLSLGVQSLATGGLSEFAGQDLLTDIGGAIDMRAA